MKLLALMNSVQEEIFAHKHIHQFNVIIMRCWERKTGNFGNHFSST